jgi:DNA-binding CsgD family transcriptional regulator
VQAALVGREPELAALGSAVDAALAGRLQVVICQGEPGIGKTRLAEELAGLARRREVRAVWGTGIDTVGAPPFWPWVEILRTICGWRDVAAIAAEHDLTADLASVAPDLVGASAGTARGPGQEDRFRQVDALSRLLCQVTSREPLVVVLDDAHWADRPSVLLVRHLARTLRAQPLLILMTCRHTENPHAADVAELAREPVTRHIDLTGLPVSAVARQLAEITGHEVSSAEAAQVHALTGGNPFFVAEVGRILPARRIGGGITPVPPNVRETIAARLGRLSSSCVQLLQAASILGRDFSVEAAAAMTDRSPLDCLAPLDEAQAAGLVEVGPTPGGYRFVHALVRDAIESALSSEDGVRLHRTAAEILENRLGSPRGPQLFELARHWVVAAVAGERIRACTWIERAAEEAMHGLAYEESARLLRLALAVADGELEPTAECRLRLRLARALHLSGDDSACLEARVAAAGLARQLGRADLLAEAALAAEAVGPTSSEEDSQRLCREALAALTDDQPALRSRVMARLAEACVYAGWFKHETLDYETAETASAQALVLAEKCGDRGALRAALRARRMACSGPEGLDERERLSERMLAFGRESADAWTQLWARLWRIDAAFERGDLAGVTREVEALASCVEDVGGPHARFELLRCSAVLAQAQGRFDDALKLAAKAFTEIGLTEHFGYQERAGLLHMIGLHFGHEASGSVEAAGLAGVTVFERPVQTAGIIVAVANAHLLASVGRLDEARAVYESLGPPARWQPSPHAVLPALAYGIHLAIAIDADADVETLWARLARYRGHHVVSGAGQVAYAGPVELWLGIAELHLGLLDAAVADLDHTVTVCGANGAAGYRIQGQVQLATALARRGEKGDVTRSRSLLESSARQAARLNMSPVKARAEHLLRQLITAGPLTRREWEVAELVAQGATNREIALRLCLSERTAQNHVQHILTKLGQSNRSQIAAWVTKRS